MTKRIIEVDIDDMAKILAGENDKHYTSLDPLKTRDEFAKLEAGSIVIRIKTEKFSKEICAWMGRDTVSAFITREDKIHLLNILGRYEEAEKLTVMLTSVRREKAQKDRDAALKEDEEDVPIEEQLLS
jgi:hypothetical protein